jgi:DNA-binding NarL/FixJ family response regulator
VELSTVKNHVHNMLEKLGAARRGEAAARVRQASLGTPTA